MRDELQELLWASHAMWVGDYMSALKFYTETLKSGKPMDPLSLYKINFELAIVSTVLKKHNLANVHIERLEEAFRDMERTRRNIRDRTELSIERIQSLTLKEFLMKKQFDRKKIDGLLREYFPRERDVLAFFISPRYAKGFLKTAIRNAEMGKVPQVLEEGIFKYTLSSELYREIGRAYSTRELELETLYRLKPVRVLIKNPNVYYVEDENLRIIAGIQREGLVLCQYLLQNSQDTVGANQIRAFLQNLSTTFSGQ